MDYFLISTSLLKIVGILFLVILPMVSYSVYAERRVSAFIQDRRGPNRVGPGGLFQPIADIFKLLLKEDFSPRHVNTFYYWLAPCLAMMPAIITIAVVPFGSTVLGVPMVIADINVGILYVFAIASLGVYGIVLAGWASNSKYLARWKFAIDQRRALSNRARLDDRAVRRRLAKPMEMVARGSDGHFIRCFRDRDFRGDESVALRSSRGRAGTRGRLSHGIFLNEVRAFFPRRIRGHDHRIGSHRDCILGRLASAPSIMARRFSLGACRRNRRGLARRNRRLVQHCNLFCQSCRGHFHVHVGALDPAQVPLRPTHAARLAVLF